MNAYVCVIQISPLFHMVEKVVFYFREIIYFKLLKQCVEKVFKTKAEEAREELGVSIT